MHGMLFWLPDYLSSEQMQELPKSNPIETGKVKLWINVFFKATDAVILIFMFWTLQLTNG